MTDVDQLRAALRLLCDQSEVTGNLPDAAYHVVVIPDSGDPEGRACTTAAAAADFLRGYAGKDVKVRVFYGRACRITRPPARYLLTHEGRFPLFDDDDTGDEIDDTGSLLAPGAVVVPGPPATGAGGSERPDRDENEDDDDEDDDEGEDDEGEDDEDGAG